MGPALVQTQKANKSNLLAQGPRDEVHPEQVWECATRSSEGTHERPEESRYIWRLSTGSTSVGTPQSEGPTWDHAPLSLTRSAWSSPAANFKEVHADCGGSHALKVRIKAAAPPGTSSGVQELRRRKYVQPSQSANHAGQPGALPLQAEVHIAGPLQRRFFGFAWRWRWCVLDTHELKIYWDEVHWTQRPEEPLEAFQVGGLVACCENSYQNCPSVLRCLDHETGHTVVTLRGGDHERWEETATTHLWVDLLNTAARIARHPTGIIATSKVSSVLWQEAMQDEYKKALGHSRPQVRDTALVTDPNLHLPFSPLWG